MKHAINRFLKPLGISLHGNGYIRKLQSNTSQKDSFLEQAQRTKAKHPVIFDVGANKGLVTQKYLTLFPLATIHAFEPFGEFHDTFLLNSAGKNVRLNKIALSDTRGKTDFFVNESPDTNSLLKPSSIGASSDKLCANKSVIQVETSTVDFYCQNSGISRIDILKLDVQGSELAVLRGAKELLEKKSIKLIFTECYFKEQYEQQPLIYDIAKYLKQFGYFLENIYDTYYNEDHLLWGDAIFVPGK